MTDSWSGWTLLGEAGGNEWAIRDVEPCDLTPDESADILAALDELHEAEGLTVEARGVCDTLRAERDEARLQLAAARSFAVSVVAKSLLRHEATCRCDWCALLSLLSAPLGAPEQVQG